MKRGQTAIEQLLAEEAQSAAQAATRGSQEAEAEGQEAATAASASIALSAICKGHLVSGPYARALSHVVHLQDELHVPVLTLPQLQVQHLWIWL